MGVSSVFDRSIAAMLPIVPRAIVRRFAKRYVAGESVEQAMDSVRALQSGGACATIDVLGEEIERLEQGDEAVAAYDAVLDSIQREGLDSNISIKLTAFGLRLDPEVCFQRVRGLVERARDLGNFVRIDMEDSSTTTDTLALYRRLRESGLDNVGVVLQAYMRRSAADVSSIADLTPSYRLCKGIYVEREEVAFKGRGEINANYLALLEQMLTGGSYVGIATHDRTLVEGAYRLIERLALPRDRYEFQMLLGVEEPLGRSIIAAGHKLRIYVPYGAEWYAYCLRRLKENPKIGRYVLLGLFRPS